MESTFIKFLESLKNESTETLIESLQDGLESITQESKRHIIGYELIDNQTKKVLKKYGPDKRRYASRQADKLDLAYGAIRYHVKPIFSE